MLKMCTLPMLLLVGVMTAWSAPAPPTAEPPKGPPAVKMDIPVEQLEHLKQLPSGSQKPNDDEVSRVEGHGTAGASDGEKPKVHAHGKYDLPTLGHKEIFQEGGKVSVLDRATPTLPTISEEQEPTPKVFHGAARLIQAGSGLHPAPPAPAVTPDAHTAHTAHRRAFNADIDKEYNNNMDHFSSYWGVKYSPLDMAEYVFWTGDEHGVTTTIEDLLQEGRMTKEEAIAFLQEIKYNIEYLKAHYALTMKAAEEQARARTLLMEQAGANKQLPSNLQSFPFGNSPDIIRTITNKNYELSNSVPMVPLEYRQQPVKRSLYPDNMVQTNVVGTSEYDRDGPTVTEEEYEEIMDKMKAADTLYMEYTLEEIIYQLAKMMFSQSLTRDPREARASIQRFMTFLEMEAERGQLSRNIEKKVLDVMVAALSDTIGDHPELVQPREHSSVNPGNRLMRQFLETSLAEPNNGMSRAILSAYKDELLKGPAHKIHFSERT